MSESKKKSRVGYCEGCGTGYKTKGLVITMHNHERGIHSTVRYCSEECAYLTIMQGGHPGLRPPGEGDG